MGIDYRKIYTKLKRENFISFIFSSFFTKTLALFGGVLLVRVLSAEEYGQYTYVINLFSMMMIVGDFGISSALLQYVSENYSFDERRNKYLILSLRCTLLFSLIPSILIISSQLWYPFKQQELKIIFSFLFLLPVLKNLIQFFLASFRAFTLNKLYAIGNILYTVAYYLFLISFGYIFGSKGAVLSHYLTCLFIIVIYVIAFHKKIKISIFAKNTISVDVKFFLRFSFASQINNIAAQVMNLLDVYILGLFYTDMTILSSYKVGSVIPTALNFIPVCIVSFFTPYLIRNNQDTKWLRKTYRLLCFGVGVFSMLIMIGGVVLSDFYIPLFFGSFYKESVLCCKILFVSFFIYSTLQCLSMNYLIIQRKVMFCNVITIIGSLLNIFLNVILLHSYGSIGVAIATIITHLFIGTVSNVYLSCLLRKK